MRASSYNITVKVDDGLYAILNSYTRTFDIINSDVNDFLKNKGESNNISDETKEKLVKRGYLTSLSVADERELVKRLLDQAHAENLFKHYNFHFILSYDCNLRCVYCYEDSILNGCHCLPKEKITKEQVDKAFEIIAEKDSGREGKKRIALYGGEPFLADNYDMILYITEKGRQLGYTFSVTSNGYDIDKYLEFLKDNKVFSFQITVDGIDEIQNNRKPHFKNKDSFEKITGNIDHLLELGFYVAVRVNTDAYGMNRIEELLSFFEKKGWYKYKHFRAYCALLREAIDVRDENYNNCEKQLNQVSLCRLYTDKKLIEKSRGKLECQDYGTYSLLKGLLLNNKLPYRGEFCGAQTGNIIFDPLGNIYSCWDVVGLPEHRVGRYIPDFYIDDERSHKWFHAMVSESKCLQCKYSLFCAGGCLAHSLRTKGVVEPGGCNEYPELFNYMIKKIYKESIKDNYARL